MRKATLSTAYIVVFITCLLIVGSSSLKLKTFSKAKAQAGNVSEISSRGMVTPGFRDQKGAGTKPTQMAYFREVINLASVFFNSNTKRRTEYISSQMWYQFRNKQIRFSVFVLNNPSNWDFSFVSQHTAWGSISPGVDAIFPNKSYMFAQQDWTGDHELIFIADQVQIGPNMTHGLTNAIENIIRLSQRQHQTCNCVRMANHIRELVNQYQSSNRWNVFCTSELNLYSRAAVRNKKYMFTKQKCYYLLYQN